MKQVLLWLLQIPVFVLIALTYMAIIRAIPTSLFMIVGLADSALRRIRKRPDSPRRQAMWFRIEGVVGLFYLVVFLYFFFKQSLWSAEWLLVWKNPLLAVLLCFVEVYQVKHLTSYNPILRQFARGALWIVWPLIVLVVFALIAPQAILVHTLKWGISFAAVACFSITAVVLWRMAGEIELLEEVDARHDQLGAVLAKYQHIVQVLGDGALGASVKEATENLGGAYSRAMSAIRRKKLAEASETLAHAEAEVTELRLNLADRIRLSLSDEIAARLNQASADCNTLQQDFEQMGLPKDGLQTIRERIATMQDALKTTSFEEDTLTRQLEPFEAVFKSIVEIRTALRFRKNVKSVQDAAQKELRTLAMHIEVSKNLKRPTDTAERLCAEAQRHLQAFPSQHVTSAEQLVEAHQRLQRSVSEAQANVNQLIEFTNKHYHIRVLDSDHIYLFVPKHATTTGPSYGGLLVQPGSSLDSALECALEGVLLNLPPSSLLTVEPPGPTAFRVKLFHFIGQRGGTGTLIVKMARPEKLADDFTFEISIKASATENARNAAVFGTPIGGLAVWLFWLLWKDIQIAAPLGIAFGGSAALIIFLVQRLRGQKRR